MNNFNSELVDKASALLTLDRQIVGIKFAGTVEEFDEMPAKAMRAKIAYCVAVKAAMAGNSVKLSAQFSGCEGSSRALGLKPPTEDFTSGECYQSFGLYKDLSTSKQVATGMIGCRHSSYGVMAQPLEKYTNNHPDVVILMADARDSMRLLQGYTYSYGSQPVFKMTGNQAICVECTSHPLETDQMNLSMLCSGTRYLAKWKPDEMAIGFPYHKFVATVDGLLKTANAVELDTKKQRIKKAMINQGLSDPDFEFGSTYYTDLEKEKKRLRRKQS